jgi:hypothetical protein
MRGVACANRLPLVAEVVAVVIVTLAGVGAATVGVALAVAFAPPSSVTSKLTV